MSIILNFFKKIVKSAGSKPVSEAPQVRIYSRSEHSISRSQISDHALKVLYRLQKSGFDAYLVGGCVRDLLLGREPKDFDVVTNAHPEEIKGVFRNCRLIGRRFRLAHVHFGNEVIEVATFRGTGDQQNDNQVTNDEGRLLRDNVYGTIEQDVWRRDFTVNALYYNIKDFSVVDYAGGMDDLKSATLRLIGDPETRFREDPVRMLRAVRFAVKLGFNLPPDCQHAMHEVAELLNSIPSARLYDEVLKLFLSGYALQTFEMLRHYGLFQVLFPETEKSLAVEENGFPKLLLIKALQNSDNRIADGKTVTPYFMLAAFLWEPVKMRTRLNRERGMDDYNAFQSAVGEVLARQVKSTAFPRHISIAMREVWSLQPKFEQRLGPKPARLLTHPRFRAAYDFLVIRAQTGDAEPELAEWWGQFQLADEAMQKKMTQPSRNLKNSRTRRRRSSKKKNTGSNENPSP
ncbi:polynucleotide adenylyltransferase PcnB [Methylomicrobium lacus]|uniref:polynucleotide adenylyltransferase PcnB n=1 Tax=Methylomicrobium lacus TaxID=136992 RepID=UPI0035A885D8